MAGVTKENSLAAALWWSLERRFGWEFWSLWRAFWRNDKVGSFERWRANTVVPVPPGTALHQLYSVPPTGRVFGSAGLWELVV